MPTLTKLQIHRPLGNASSILERLSTPGHNDSRELVWPCSQLAHLYINVMQIIVAQRAVEIDITQHVAQMDFAQ
ncbi:hypothetical protein FRB97_006328 [Tulasnella sp. 331]|nr:hypothetical protein FRB97_006328 [Tulasnella sp. 331]